jgi:hypothetical protein
MAQTFAGLPSAGRSQFFNFQYEETLSQGRGLELAREMLMHCDDDLALLVQWFSGRQLDMSPPINVSINSVATDANGNPVQFVGGHWGPSAGPFPLQVTINIGELPMASGTAVELARYLLVTEVSEMFMRAFDLQGTYPWFRFGEGNKGEALSRFLGAEFLHVAYPFLTQSPSLMSGGFTSSSSWLNSPRSNFLEVNDDSIDPADPDVGGATLFLCYLHDQLGYSIQQIINAGAGHLSNVYENLTGRSWTTAWDTFSNLVNSHYPSTFPDGSSRSHFPPFETVFPVADLSNFLAPSIATWGPHPARAEAVVIIDRPAPLPLLIDLRSSHPEIIASEQVLLAPPSPAARVFLNLPVQSEDFQTTKVTLTASYAGKSLTTAVTVVAPGEIALPDLELDIDLSDDPCRIPFVQHTEATFYIRSSGALRARGEPSYQWIVSGATPAAVDGPTLTIPELPTEGTAVTLSVVVTTAEGLKAKGLMTFLVRGEPQFKELNAELRCRLNRLINVAHPTKPGEPVENLDQLRERVGELSRQIEAMAGPV